MFKEFKFRPEHWGHLVDRYREPKPRKLLALDGGGLRGLITLGFLKRLEEELAKTQDDPDSFLLADFFDYIGGTSTGAIIAAGLATGRKVEEIQKFYEEFAKGVFQSRIFRWRGKYRADNVERNLKRVFRDELTLEPDFLECLFLAVTRNATTDSVWPISSNPAARFNDPSSRSNNLKIPLWEIVRASAAAPTFFPSRTIVLDPNRKEHAFEFVDGGTTAYNNPAFLLYRMATEQPYYLRWETGERNLLLVSVGTGRSKALSQAPGGRKLGFTKNVQATINSLMHQAVIDQDTVCRNVGRCTYGDELDFELGNLIPRDSQGQPIPLSTDLGRKFLYARYNVELSEAGLERIGLAEIEPENVAPLDSLGAMEDLKKIGKALGREFDRAHLGTFVTEVPGT